MYSRIMEYNNDRLAGIIISIDPSADWVYNKYCGFCGKFLYPEEVNSRCKKCKTLVTSSDHPIVKRPIPFLSSATAIEKLIVWMRNHAHKSLLDKIADIIRVWIRSNRSPETYRLEIVIACVNALLQEHEAQ